MPFRAWAFLKFVVICLSVLLDNSRKGIEMIYKKIHKDYYISIGNYILFFLNNCSD